MPLYNSERFVEQALRSLLSQTFEEFEIIACDNASTDRTAEIVADLAALDNRIRLVRNKRNRGLVFNFNRAFELSSGELFRWHAYDDFCLPTYLEKCVEALDADSGAIGAFSLAHQVDAEGVVVNTVVEEGLKASLGLDCRITRMRATITLNGWSGVVHGLFRRSTLTEVMPYRGYFGADRMMLTQLALRGRMVAVADGLWLQRYHENNSSRRSTREIAEILTGRPRSGLMFPVGKAFFDYLRLFRDPELGPSETARAVAYLLFHGIRPDVVYNLIVPGPNNYFGLDLRQFGVDRFRGGRGRPGRIARITQSSQQTNTLQSDAG